MIKYILNFIKNIIKKIKSFFYKMIKKKNTNNSLYNSSQYDIYNDFDDKHNLSLLIEIKEKETFSTYCGAMHYYVLDRIKYNFSDSEIIDIIENIKELKK